MAVVIESKVYYKTVVAAIGGVIFILNYLRGRAEMINVAAIHDLAGLGRTSLNVVIPILTTLGIEVCPLPTAILSSSTESCDNFYFYDLTASMHPTLAHWRSLNVQFDAVYSGFLGSPEQVDIVAECAQTCLRKEGLFIVDPVMGEDGNLEPTMGEEMVTSMRRLVSQATCITPNLTEAAFLLNEPFPGGVISGGVPQAMLKDWLRGLTELGPDLAVITSVPMPGDIIDGKVRKSVVGAFDKKTNRFWRASCDYIPANYPGTGDIFTSVLTGCLLRGDSLPEAIDRAVQFVALAIRATFGFAQEAKEGVRLERVLHTLGTGLGPLTYRLMDDEA